MSPLAAFWVGAAVGLVGVPLLLIGLLIAIPAAIAVQARRSERRSERAAARRRHPVTRGAAWVELDRDERRAWHGEFAAVLDGQRFGLWRRMRMARLSRRVTRNQPRDDGWGRP